MSEAVEIWEVPEGDEVYMLAGWRQWADAGSMSSGLPQYLIEHTGAHQIGQIRTEDFYLFQFPGTHDLVRPVVKFVQGYPEGLDTPNNEIYYSGNEGRGLVLFLGDEPHLNVERYVSAMLDAAEALGVRRIVSFGGVYGALPYDKERMISCTYSLPHLRRELDNLSVTFSDYQGGASIGSYLCRRAGERGMEYVGLYAFVPSYDFSQVGVIGNTIRIENDYTAWLGTMRRVSHMLKLDLDLDDLERKSARVLEVVEAKVAEIERLAPQLGVREYMAELSEQFEEQPFEPLGAIWEEELSRLFDDDEERGEE
jgi:proteasome assembly chaperone (PAC2) family protein